MKKNDVILVGFLLCCLCSCTLFKKRISKPITVAVPQTSVHVLIHSTAAMSKYTDSLSGSDVAYVFLKAFESEAGYTQNIVYTKDTSNADFIVRIKSVNISESSFTEKVEDAASPYNGQSVTLNSIDCSAYVEVINAKTKLPLEGNCSNSKIRSEKLTNNRDAVELLTGSNKDKTIYRTKLLNGDICLKLAEDVGRRIWVPITRKLSKNS